MSFVNYTKDDKIQALLSELSSKGWVVSKRSKRGAHPIVTSPEGQSFTFASTSSDKRGYFNFERMIRRYEEKVAEEKKSKFASDNLREQFSS